MGAVSFPRLHVITDDLDVVRAVAQPGVAVQIRVKTNDFAAYAVAREAVPRCRTAGALCLVNDRIGVALATGADGVHLGADDLPVAAARRVLGPEAVIGATCRTPEAARAAVADGATYLGVGPAFPTSTKDGLPPPLGPDGVNAVAAAVPGIPVVAIGGITLERVGLLTTYGVAAVKAFDGDPAGAAAAFLAALQ
ncbi:thiamine-phosphate pyrophosphorylase [Actinoplanes sp. SE50]|uniref:thiamine phosphate synthase n=1 Tax=unclassified Actinoplanes TaxID=2626549 RepID=UPI00023ED542|nr:MULTISPECIES: thiamine phosphate synthase [unclassified Actinoplanes]AEV81714.1 thiamine-phosphate pyrophosphorylase [Actinoplanes sp. SE50/110]ATO80115.1 thiamine-phosphate pyrophosphorylase [Actinoplanes sp. SE50]SLL97519.1 thiamine phosphate synthase [Actinoplanes sp. SE50/110]